MESCSKLDHFFELSEFSFEVAKSLALRIISTVVLEIEEMMLFLGAADSWHCLLNTWKGCPARRAPHSCRT